MPLPWFTVSSYSAFGALTLVVTAILTTAATRNIRKHLSG
jgi:hypothetical protein